MCWCFSSTFSYMLFPPYVLSCCAGVPTSPTLEEAAYLPAARAGGGPCLLTPAEPTRTRPSLHGHYFSRSEANYPHGERVVALSVDSHAFVNLLKRVVAALFGCFVSILCFDLFFRWAIGAGSRQCVIQMSKTVRVGHPERARDTGTRAGSRYGK